MKRKFFFFLFLLLTGGLAIFYVWKGKEQNKVKPIKYVYNFKRTIFDSFIPKSKDKIVQLDYPVYRTSYSGDTAYFLTEKNNIYSIKNGNFLSKNKFCTGEECWYFKIERNDTSVFMPKRKVFVSQNLGTTLKFSTDVSAVEDINDTTLLVHYNDKKQSYFSVLNLKNNNQTNQFPLQDKFDKTSLVDLSQNTNLLTGMFSKNSKSLYYTFYNAGYILQYNIKKQTYTLHRTIDSTPIPQLIKKKLTLGDKSIFTYEIEREFLNLGTTCDEKFLYILSTLTTDKNYKHIDMYDSETLQYIKTIKMFKDDEDGSVFEIKKVNNKIYFGYNNENLYAKELPN